MKVALGFSVHSGWAALVVVGQRDGAYVVVDRRRIELVEEAWAKQPYHAAERLEPEPARTLVTRGIEAARRISLDQVQAAVQRERERNNEVTACAVPVANPMPNWSVDEILAVHFRMHKAEGVLFRDALVYAGKACGLRVLEIPERLLATHVEAAKNATALGKSVGPPWGKDQKDATLAAMLALQSHGA